MPFLQFFSMIRVQSDTTANTTDATDVLIPMRRTPKNDPNALRAQLDGSLLLAKILELAAFIEQGWMPEYSKPLGNPHDPGFQDQFKVVDWQILGPSGVARLKVTMDFYMRLLAKVMPDLKSVEVNDARSSQDATLSPTERATKLFAALSTIPEGQQFLQGLKNKPANPTNNQGDPSWH